MPKVSRHLIVLPKPPRRLGRVLTALVIVVWAFFRIVVFRALTFPLSYIIPLMLGVWTCDRAAVWTMALAFGVMQTVHSVFNLPDGAFRTLQGTATLGAALFNISLGAALVHVIISFRLGLEDSAGELGRQHDELATQSEALTQQGEALAQQNHQLNIQTEEIRHLLDDVSRRGGLLEALLALSRVQGTGSRSLERIADSARELFSDPDALVAVYERTAEGLVLRAASAGSDAASFASRHALVDLVLEDGKAAAVDDAARRPELLLPVGAGAALAAPIHSASVPGAILVCSRRPRVWSEEDVRLAGWLAGRCADVLESAWLQADLRRQASLIDLSPDAIMVRTVAGKIVSWSAGAVTLYGWTREEALGRMSHDLLQTRYVREEAAATTALRETGAWTGELTHVTKHGTDVVVRSRWLLYSRDGDGEVLESNVDITDARRALNALHEADRRKSEFLAMLSHELRNPLAPMQYALELMQQRDAGADPEAVRLRQVLDRQLRHLRRLVDDLLDVTRITSNKLQLRRQRVDLLTVVTHACEVTQPEIERLGHHLSVSVPGSSVWLDGDEDRLVQVLTNLLNNAARYTPSGGKIDVSVHVSGDEVTVTVSDSGVGLGPEDLDRVFDMFTQGTSAGGGGGLGIGLALVKGVVELHAGRVEASSGGAGRGSTFTVTLPVALAPGAVAGVAPHDRRAETGTPRRILVVDDNTDAAEMLKAFLDVRGHAVRIAHDGHTALRVIDTFTPDIAFLDIGLPGMSGYDLAEALRRDDRTRDIRLVAVTGWGHDEDRARAAHAGFNEHITKPADPVHIERIIAKTPPSTSTDSRARGR